MSDKAKYRQLMLYSWMGIFLQRIHVIPVKGVESEETVDRSGYKEKAESRMKFYDDSKKPSDRSGS